MPFDRQLAQWSVDAIEYWNRVVQGVICVLRFPATIAIVLFLKQHPRQTCFPAVPTLTDGYIRIYYC